MIQRWSEPCEEKIRFSGSPAKPNVERSQLILDDLSRPYANEFVTEFHFKQFHWKGKQRSIRNHKVVPPNQDIASVAESLFFE